jgi:endonuclease/exonuclease/phosphatase family metal-dependent hydrolase
MQVARIQKAVHEVGLPAVVACDCNMTDLTAAYSTVTETLRDAHRERGWGFGHTFLAPRGLEIPSRFNVAVQRIDYLLHTPDITARTFKVIRKPTGSDHLPILAQLDLGARPNGVP